MAELVESKSAAFGASVSEIFNNELKVDQNAMLKAASIIRNDPNFNRRPDYWINIFNITPVEHKRQRPVDFPQIVLRACPKEKPWIIAFRAPNIVNYKWVSADTNQPGFHSLRGERFATDLLNPANLGENIWAATVNGDIDLMHGSGEDLTRRGFFWEIRQKADSYCEACEHPSDPCPVHDVPSAEALRRTKIKLEAHYNVMVKQGEKLASDPKTSGEIGEEHHRAADYLHVNASWHRQTTVQESCPNCGDTINPGIAYHASSVGGVCVISWERACKAGVVRREDVPIDCRWWTEESEPEHRGPGRPRKVVEGQ